MMIEQNTNYAYKMKYMTNPSFDKVRELSAKFYRELPQELQDELHEALHRGIDILDSEPQMTAYIFAFGKMHQAKLNYAFDKLSDNFFEQKEINIIDYGCGQAIGTMCYADFLRKNHYSQKVKTITLIEPSEICLKRAALHTSVFFPDAELKTVNKKFNDLNENDIICSEKTPSLHILSNVLDILNFDIYNFAELIKTNLKGKNQFVCVAPYYNGNEKDNRMDLFASKINGSNIITRKYKANEFIPEKEWTCKISCFQKDVGSFEIIENSGLEPHTIYYEADEKIEVSWNSDSEEWKLLECCKWIEENSVNHEFSNGKGKIILKDGVNEIGIWAFLNCSGPTTILIPNSITTIGYESFYGCKGLKYFVIPDSVTKIERDAFACCCGLTAIYYNGDIAGWCGFSFGEYDYYDENNGAWIGFNPLSYAHNLYIGNELITNLIIPNIVTEIKPFAFCGATCLASVIIPNSIMKIGVGAFSGCNGLTSINIPNSITEIGENVFADCCGLTSIIISNSVTKIGSSAFENCSKLTSINIPNSVTEIESNAFKDCVGLKSIIIPDSVTKIGRSAFENCSKLTSINIPNSVTEIGMSAFYGCSGLASINIPNSVTEIGEYAFGGCNGLASINIPPSVRNVGIGVFSNCVELASIVVSTGNRKYDSRGNCNAIIETATNKLVAGCMNTAIPNSVTKIGYSAFKGCSGLASINIPDSVSEIGDFAFSGCNRLMSVIIPNFVTSIGDMAFNNTGWYNNQPDGILYLDGWCLGYKGEKPAGTLIIAEGTKGIASCAFYGCSELMSVIIPNSVSRIGRCAFSHCSKLTAINIPKYVTEIGGFAFSDCRSLQQIIIPKGFTDKFIELIELNNDVCDDIWEVSIVEQ